MEKGVSKWRMGRVWGLVALMLCMLLPQGVATAATNGMNWPGTMINVFTPSSGGVWYPRLVKLSATEWLMSFDTNEGGGRTQVKVSRTVNGGQNWSAATTAVSSTAGDVGNGQLLRLNDGRLWLAYRLVVQTGSTYQTYLRVKQSTDGGAIWSDLAGGEIASATASSFKGVWEPQLGYIGGTIAVMYADDGPAAVGSTGLQNLYMKTWTGSGWSAAILVSNGVAAGSRDGMPVFAQMNDGRYIVVFESSDVAGHPFVIKYKLSASGLDWSGARQTMYVPTGNGKKAGAPFVVKLGDGRLMASFQTDEDSANTGDNYSSMRTLISADNGATWQDKYNVFPVSDNASSNWNALMPIDGTRVAAVTSATYPHPGVFLRIGQSATPAGVNLVNNWGFETANVNGWTTYGDDYPSRILIHGINDGIARPAGGGNYFVGLSGVSGPATAYIGQTITGLDNGTYTLRAYLRSSGGQSSAVMEVKDYGGAMRQTAFPVTTAWTQVTIGSITVTQGKATIGFYVANNAASQWADIDNVEFIRN